jgi:hypothetical protein
VFLFNSALNLDSALGVLNLDSAVGALNMYTSKIPSAPRSNMHLDIVKVRDAYIKFRLVLRCILYQDLDGSVLVDNKLKMRLNRDHTKNVSL